jgi:hypothetical protein
MHASFRARLVCAAGILVAAVNGCGSGADSPSAPSVDTTPLADVQGQWRMLAAAQLHTCGLSKSGIAYCWGRNDRNQIGDSTIVTRSTPTRVATTARFSSIAAGGYTSCAIAASGEAYCWGLYNGAVNAPQLVDATHKFTSLAASRYKVCGIGVDATVYCWTTINGTPANPTALTGNLRFKTLVAGSTRFCGVTTPDGATYCWIDDIEWNPNGAAREPYSPAAAALAVGGSPSPSGHVCALDASGAASCWGSNDTGELGDGSITSRPTPVSVLGGFEFASIAASLTRTCAVAVSNSAGYCWGSYEIPASLPQRTRPEEVLLGFKVASFAMGDQHTCAVTPGGAAFCWGVDSDGQLGDGNVGLASFEPRRVPDPPVSQ